MERTNEDEVYYLNINDNGKWIGHGVWSDYRYACWSYQEGGPRANMFHLNPKELLMIKRMNHSNSNNKVEYWEILDQSAIKRYAKEWIKKYPNF